MARTASYTGIGIVLGTALGAAFHNIPVGIALGLVFGAAVSRRLRKPDAKGPSSP